jgi:hypothetical protein
MADQQKTDPNRPRPAGCPWPARGEGGFLLVPLPGQVDDAFVRRHGGTDDVSGRVAMDPVGDVGNVFIPQGWRSVQLGGDLWDLFGGRPAYEAESPRRWATKSVLVVGASLSTRGRVDVFMPVCGRRSSTVVGPASSSSGVRKRDTRPFSENKYPNL